MEILSLKTLCVQQIAEYNVSTDNPLPLDKIPNELRDDILDRCNAKHEVTVNTLDGKNCKLNVDRDEKLEKIKVTIANTLGDNFSAPHRFKVISKGVLLHPTKSLKEAGYKLADPVYLNLVLKFGRCHSCGLDNLCSH